jgi:hypothetical protein
MPTFWRNILSPCYGAKTQIIIIIIVRCKHCWKLMPKPLFFFMKFIICTSCWTFIYSCSKYIGYIFKLVWRLLHQMVTSSLSIIPHLRYLIRETYFFPFLFIQKALLILCTVGLVRLQLWLRNITQHYISLHYIILNYTSWSKEFWVSVILIL